MAKKTIWTAAILLAAAALIALLFLPRENLPSPDARVVLEHTYRTYIAPSCFEESNPTNFIEDGTLERARELGYPPDTACTEKAFQGNNDSFFIDFLKELGILEKETPDW
jgi:hypothetical protein